MVDGGLVWISNVRIQDKANGNVVYWWITLNHKTVLASSIGDLNQYKVDKSYIEVIEAAKTWFSVLDEMRKRNIRAKDFQNTVRDKTLVCSFVGGHYQSKTMIYPWKNIIFQYVLKLDQKHGYIWELPEVSVKFFKKWCLYSAPWSRIGFYKDIYTLFDALYADYEVTRAGMCFK